MLKAISGWDGWMAMEISVISTSSKSTALRAVLIIIIMIIIMSNKFFCPFQTHHFVATAVDETLATFGANLSEMCQIIEMVQ